MSHGRVRALAVAVLTAALLAGAGGCAASSDLSEAAAERLQDAVAGVVAAAEGGRYDEALARAAAARTELEWAADAGELSAQRYRRIDEALTRTEAELDAALAAASAPAAPAAAQEPAPAPEEAATGGDERPGNGRDNGRDNNNGRGSGNANGRGDD